MEFASPTYRPWHLLLLPNIFLISTFDKRARPGMKGLCDSFFLYPEIDVENNA